MHKKQAPKTALFAFRRVDTKNTGPQWSKKKAVTPRKRGYSIKQESARKKTQLARKKNRKQQQHPTLIDEDDPDWEYQQDQQDEDKLLEEPIARKLFPRTDASIQVELPKVNIPKYFQIVKQIDETVNNQREPLYVRLPQVKLKQLELLNSMHRRRKIRKDKSQLRKIQSNKPKIDRLDDQVKKLEFSLKQKQDLLLQQKTRRSLESKDVKKEIEELISQKHLIEQDKIALQLQKHQLQNQITHLRESSAVLKRQLQATLRASKNTQQQSSRQYMEVQKKLVQALNSNVKLLDKYKRQQASKAQQMLLKDSLLAKTNSQLASLRTAYEKLIKKNAKNIQRGQKAQGIAFYNEQRANHLAEDILELKEKILDLQSLKEIQHQAYRKQKQLLVLEKEALTFQKEQNLVSYSLNISELRQQIVLIYAKQAQLQQLYGETLQNYQNIQEAYKQVSDIVRERQEHISDLIEDKQKLEEYINAMRDEFVQYDQKKKAQYSELEQQRSQAQFQYKQIVAQLRDQLNESKLTHSLSLRQLAAERSSKKRQITAIQAQQLSKRRKAQAQLALKVKQQDDIDMLYADEFKKLQLKYEKQVEEGRQQIQQIRQRYNELNQQYYQYRVGITSSLSQLQTQFDASKNEADQLKEQLAAKELLYSQMEAHYQERLSLAQTALMERSGILEARHNVELTILMNQLNNEKYLAQNLTYQLSDLTGQLLRQRQVHSQTAFEGFRKQGRISQLQSALSVASAEISHLQADINRLHSQIADLSRPASNLGIHNLDSQTIYPQNMIPKVTVSTNTHEGQMKIEATLSQKIEAASNLLYQEQVKNLRYQIQWRQDALQLKAETLLLQQKKFAQLQGKFFQIEKNLSQTSQKIVQINKATEHQNNLIRQSHQKQLNNIKEAYHLKQEELFAQIGSLQSQLRTLQVQKREIMDEYQSSQSQISQLSTVRTQIDEKNVVLSSLQLSSDQQIAINLGQQYLLLKKYQGKFWWGIAVQKPDGSKYFTQKAVQFKNKYLFSELIFQYQHLRTFQEKKKKKVTFGDGIMLILDCYRQNNYVGVRHFNYYANEPQPTRYGFNVTIREFNAFINKANQYLRV